MSGNKKLAHPEFEDDSENSDVGPNDSDSSSQSEPAAKKSPEFYYPIGVKDDKDANIEWFGEALCEIEGGEEPFVGCIITKPGEKLPEDYKIGEPPKDDNNLSRYVFTLHKSGGFPIPSKFKDKDYPLPLFKNVLRRSDGKFIPIAQKHRGVYHPHAPLKFLREQGLLDIKNVAKKNICTVTVENQAWTEGDPKDEKTLKLHAPIVDPELLYSEIEKEISRLNRAEAAKQAKEKEVSEPPKNPSKLWSRSSTLTRLEQTKTKKQKQVKGDPSLLSKDAHRKKKASIDSLPQESTAPAPASQDSPKKKKKTPVADEPMDVDKPTKKHKAVVAESMDADKPTKKRKAEPTKESPKKSAKRTFESCLPEVYSQALKKHNGKLPNVFEEYASGIDSVGAFRAKYAEDEEFRTYATGLFAAVANYPKIVQSMLPAPKATPAPAPPPEPKKKKIAIAL